ncbi:MAG: DNA replication and repair protein RecF [Weeksellaceae bacterium]|nr:DNA replication and repair protein RecF [Weeksellaceae bacterium]
MHIAEIQLNQFKNFPELHLQFSPNINALVGKNGLGKTNVLDAVHYLGTLRSNYQSTHSQAINRQSDFFRIQGKFITEGVEDSIVCTLKRGSKKSLSRNQKEYTRLADHIGRFPVVMISPYDRDLILEGSEVRRKFMDSIISQSDSIYLNNLVRYTKVLKQRNTLLKYFAQNRTFDSLQLEIFDHELLQLGREIHNKRKTFHEQFRPVFLELYAFLAQGTDAVEIEYTSHLHDNQDDTYLQESLAKDRILQYTTKGIHKDDLRFTLDQVALKSTGSQGQQKTFLIALKLAQNKLISRLLNKTPILLLDDIFDKLDEHRVSRLISLVNDSHFGQIFISDTHPERMESLLQQLEGDSLLIDLEQEIMHPNNTQHYAEE